MALTFVLAVRIAVFAETLEKRSVNHLFWNPNGQFIVLAGLRRYSLST